MPRHGPKPDSLRRPERRRSRGSSSQRGPSRKCPTLTATRRCSARRSVCTVCRLPLEFVLAAEFGRKQSSRTGRRAWSRLPEVRGTSSDVVGSSVAGTAQERKRRARCWLSAQTDSLAIHRRVAGANLGLRRRRAPVGREINQTPVSLLAQLLAVGPDRPDVGQRRRRSVDECDPPTVG
jgi:hypothetical protein